MEDEQTELKIGYSKMDSACVVCGTDLFNTVIFKNMNHCLKDLPKEGCVHLDCYVKHLVEIYVKEYNDILNEK